MQIKIDHSLATQIVNTVKDVCGQDVNFIDQSGIIFASTNPERVGTFHEIGQKAAATGNTIEVSSDNSFYGSQKGINFISPCLFIFQVVFECFHESVT